MVRYKLRGNYNGEITVFLSIVSLLVLALVCTLIESARVTAARVLTERSLEIGLDSLFSNYNREVWDNYHLFLLNHVGNGIHADSESMSSEIEKYMGFTIWPQKNFNPINVGDSSFLDLYSIIIQNIEIEGITRYTDYDGDILIHQASEYMKYKSPESLMEKLLNNLGLLKTAAKSSQLIEQELKTAEKLSELSKSLAELIRMTEGIGVNESGIHFLKNGNIAAETSFAKRLCNGSVNKQGVGINHDIVFRSLRDKYINPMDILKGIRKDIKTILDCIDERDRLLSEQENRESIPMENESIDSSANDLHGRIDELNRNISDKKANILMNIDMLERLVEDTLKAAKGAILAADEVQRKKAGIEGDLREFENLLNINRGNIDSELSKGLDSELSDMEEFLYGQNQKDSYNLLPIQLDNIKKILISNRTILSMMDFRGLKTAVRGNIHSADGEADLLMNKFGNYSISELVFDYSTLIPYQDVQSPVKSFRRLIKDGIFGLIIDNSEEISMNKLTQQDIPSKLGLENKGDKEDSFYDAIAQKETDGYQPEIKNIFKEYTEDCKNVPDQDIKKESVLKGVLFHEYILNHFKRVHISEEKAEKEQRTVLQYEQEYILMGLNNDKDNLYQMVTKLLLFRTLFNFIYLMTDKERAGQAAKTAAALVGFTCLQPVITLTKMMIMVIWAFEESLIDVRVLLYGGDIPLLKKQTQFKTQYEDLLKINKEFIKNSADEVLKQSDKGSFRYEDYMHLFLYLKHIKDKAYRVMDLIQVNTNQFVTYDFNIMNSIFGVQVRLDYNIRSQFIDLPFNRKKKRESDGQFHFTTKKAYAY